LYFASVPKEIKHNLITILHPLFFFSNSGSAFRYLLNKLFLFMVTNFASNYPMIHGNYLRLQSEPQ